MFEREDWELFRSRDTLCQKAGVAPLLLRRLVIKELVDNALDVAGHCFLEATEDGTYLISDHGPGMRRGTMPMSAVEIAALFSIRRPLTSSKLLRLPMRGALGNGLRVVAGAVLSSAGRLAVTTNGIEYELTPRDDGHTDIRERRRCEHPGTRVEIWLGPGIPDDDENDPLAWGNAAIAMASGGGSTFGKRTSPWWYDDESFLELCRAAKGQTVRDVISQFDGCSGAKAGTVAARFKSCNAPDLTREQAAELLTLAREAARPVKAQRIGSIGRANRTMPAAYAKSAGEFTTRPARATIDARIPYVVEAWARPSTSDRVSCFVNRTPTTDEVAAYHGDGREGRAELTVYGCGLQHAFKVGIGKLDVTLNVTTPYMPIVTDGKSPDLSRCLTGIANAVTAVARKARRCTPAGDKKSNVRELVEQHMDEAIAKASGDGERRYSQRQLFYSARELILKRGGPEPAWKWFCQIITIMEAEGRGPANMYRDVRGVLYHPHEGIEIPLGTLAVEKYARPRWTFNKILYCEKEGLFPLLKSEKWPERNDCALMSAKGYATRAARDVLDLLAETGESVTFFCIHDADASGTKIYETLAQGTLARAARTAHVVNLGLDPWEAVTMGLTPEGFKAKGRRPVAAYVHERDESRGEQWATWLQTKRVELNAMDSPQFLSWLDRKMAEHAKGGKVIPPADVLAERLQSDLRDVVHRDLTERAIREAQVERRTDEAVATLSKSIERMNGNLATEVRRALKRSPEQHWTAPIQQRADRMAAGAFDGAHGKRGSARKAHKGK